MDMDELGARPMTYREKLLSIGTVDLCGLVDLDRAEQLAIEADAEIARLKAKVNATLDAIKENTSRAAAKRVFAAVKAFDAARANGGES